MESVGKKDVYIVTCYILCHFRLMSLIGYKATYDLINIHVTDEECISHS